jgi:RNA recognition motif-containing protein
MPEQKLYIGNLPYRTTEGDVREYLRNYGPIYSVILIYNSETGQTRGYGFVELENAAAEAVLRELNDTQFMGRNLKIRKASGKENPQRKCAADLTVTPSKTAAEGFGYGNTAARAAACRNIGGNFLNYEDFKRDFKKMFASDKCYNIEREDYGLYQAYKFEGSKMDYSGPSNVNR